MSLFDEGLSEFRAVVDGFQVKAEADLAVLTRDFAAAVAAGGDKDAEIATLKGQIAELRARIAEIEKAPDPEPEEPPVEPPVEPEEPPVVVPPVVPASGLYGPTGKHWPARTPKLTDTAEFVQEVSCTWAAIKTAIQAANTPANVGKSARINVARGNLTGLGGGATSKAVIESVGVKGRAGGRILITPKDGAGAVNIVGSSARFHLVEGVTLAGFNGHQWGQAEKDAKGILLTGCKDVAVAWSKSRYFNITNSGVQSEDIEFVECVSPDSYLWGTTEAAADRWQWKHGTTGNESGLRIKIVGSYLAPVRTQNGSAAHLDMLQLLGNGPWDVEAIDTIGFAATNAGIITTNGTGFVLNHTLIVGGDSVKERYKLEPNAEDAVYDGSPWPLNGSPNPAILKNGSIITGTPKGWNITYDATSGQRKSMTKAEIDAVSIYPTDEYLQSIWR